MNRNLLALGAVAVLASGCVAHGSVPTPQPANGGSGTLPVDDSHHPVSKLGTCHLGGTVVYPLPDPSCTPGAVNPGVTQANIRDTICKPGWTSTVRPPVSVTNKIKHETDLAYSIPVNTLGELDHLVSLELGGGPDDPRNLWVEPGKIPNNKDTTENRLNKAVCSGKVTLVQAQQAIASNWTTALKDLGLA